MASLQRRGSGLYLLTFRYQGQQVQRSVETHDPDEADRLKSAAEQRLRLLRDGTFKLPEGATVDELWDWLRHGRFRDSLPKLVKKISLGDAAEKYLSSYSPGTKEPETLETERVHLNNIKRLIGESTSLHSLKPDDIRRYIELRQQERGNRGGNIKSDTIRKELQTVRLLWVFAVDEGYATGESPLVNVRRPKKRRKPPFQTWEQIEQRMDRGGLNEQQHHELWECLFLREVEIGELLQHVAEVVKRLPRFPYIYPALSFCAYTGARRSEMFRCLIDDVNDDWIMLREKKRDRDVQFTFRYVPLHRELREVLDTWQTRHPGGQYLFCKNGREPLDDRTSREAFKAVVKGSKWKVLHGYHVLRHSFASNLARSGRVSQAEIDELMGHQTEEMRLRYRHLCPEDKRRAVEVLSFAAE